MSTPMNVTRHVTASLLLFWLVAPSGKAEPDSYPEKYRDPDFKLPHSHPNPKKGDAGIMGAVSLDMNQDGWPDLVLATGHYSIAHIAIHLNENGTISNQAAWLSHDKNSHLKMISDDLNKDGNPDLVVGYDAAVPGTVGGSYISGGLKIYMSDDSFELKIRPTPDWRFEWSEYASPWELELADINGDGEKDILVGSLAWHTHNGFYSPGNPLYDRRFLGGILLNHGGGVFEKFDWTPPSDVSALKAVDLDRDGALEVLAFLPEEIQVYSFTKDGSNAPALRAILRSTLPLATQGTHHLVDLDQDGFADLIAIGEFLDSSGQARKTLFLFRGISGGFDLADPVLLAEKSFAVDLAHGDLNQDGRIDLIFGNWGGNRKSAQVFLGDGDFRFRRSTYLSTPFTEEIILEDFNKDGWLDAFFGNGMTAIAGMSGAAHLYLGGAFD